MAAIISEIKMIIMMMMGLLLLVQAFPKGIKLNILFAQFLCIFAKHSRL